MFEQTELWGIPMGPHGPPNAKGTAKIAREIAILVTRPFWSFGPIWAKQAISDFGHFGSPFPSQG